MSEIQIPIQSFYERLPQWGEEFLTEFDDNPEMQNFLLVCHRRARKTTICLNLEIREAVAHKKNTYAYIFPTFKQAKAVLWRDPKMIKTYLPSEILAKPFNETELVADFVSGSSILIGGADQPDRWRGMGCVGWILDEYATMKNAKEMREEIIEPIIRENHGWVIYPYTPKGRNVGWEYFEKAKKLKWIHKLVTADNSGIFTGKDLEEAKLNMPEHLYQQEMLCFPKGTDIITSDGVRDITEVKIGNFVLAHSGRFRKVKKILEREYSGNLLKIISYGNNKPIFCTPEHPIRICNNGVNHEWKKAKDVKIGDKVVFPRILKGEHKIISKELSILLSWFISEGHYHKGNVGFSLNKNEKDHQNEIIKCLSIIIPNQICKVNINRGSAQLIISNRELGEFFTMHCGSGAENKKIPFTLIKGHENIVYETLIKGDGCRKGTDDSFTTISKHLAYQLQLLAHCLGYSAGISLSRPARIEIIEGRQVNCKEIYIVRINRQNNKYFAKKRALKITRHKYSILARVNKIEEIEFNGRVYNFDVEFDHSYTANGRSVHNCQFLVSGGGVIKRVGEAIAGKLQQALPGHRYVMGVDLARKVDWTVLTVIDCDTRQVVAFERFQKVDWSFQKERIAAMARRYNNAFIILDSTGVGDPIEQDLAQMNLSVRGFKFTGPSKKQLIEKLILAIEDRRITYPKIEELIEELEAFDIDEKGRYGAPTGFSDDCVISLALAVDGLGAEIYTHDEINNEELYQPFSERFGKKIRV